MDADFVNVFVEKQRESLNDLFSRNIMLDARVTFAESKIQQMLSIEQQAADAQVTHVALLNDMQLKHDKQLAELRSTISEQAELMKRYQIELAAAASGKETFEHAQTTIKEQVTEIEQLRKSVNLMAHEKEVQRARADNIKKKAKQLIED